MSKLNYAGKHVQGASKGDIEQLALMQSLPPIRGQWFFVDPKKGALGGGAKTLDTATTSIREAYNLCTTSVGDGICILAYPSATTADTTTYLGGNLSWGKHGITVVGVSAPHVYNGRARISAKDRAYTASTLSWTAAGVVTDSASGFLTAGFEAGDTILCTATDGTAITSLNLVASVTASTMTLTDVVTANAAPGAATMSTHSRPMITVSGRGNYFKNISFINGGTVATDDGAVYVSAVDNCFEDCYFNGATSATVAAETTAYDLTVVTSECRFKGCIFGSNATDRAEANAHIVLGNSTTAIGQVYFEDCRVISCSNTAGHGAISVANAATLGGYVEFANCRFINWYASVNPTALTTVIIGATPNNCGIALPNSYEIGWAAWGANNDTWFTGNAAGAAGTGGIMDHIA